MSSQKCLSVLVAALVSLFVSAQLFAQSEVIEKRQKLMKGNSADSKAIKKAVQKKDYATIELKAKDIAEHMAKAPELFPKGSTSDKSRAKPEIWKKWDDFAKAAGRVKTAASELSEAAAAKDEAKVNAKFKALGSACSNCHKQFRAEKKKDR